MKNRPLSFSLAVLGLLALAAAPPATAQNFDTNQDAALVLGQTSFNATAPATPASATSQNQPLGVAVDPTTGKVFVADFGNHRVLRYASSPSLANGDPAEMVFGQGDFASNLSNRGSANPTPNTLSEPVGLFVDSVGTLWVADGGNNRVLAFASASTLALNANAIRVIGQSNFISKTNTTASTGLFNPLGVFVSAANTLFIADSFNNRVLGYQSISATASNAPAADLVVGQAAFGSGGDGNGNGASQMFTPTSVFVDDGGRLWVTDRDNRRVLRFDNAGSLPAANASANGVLGQPGFNVTVPIQTTAAGMSFPYVSIVDADGTLYVSDLSFNRVTIFPNAATAPNGASASGVLGQPNFTNVSSSIEANTLPGAAGLTFDLQGDLFVANSNADRTTRFTKAAAPAPPTPERPSRPVLSIDGKKRMTTSRSRFRLKGEARVADGTVRRVEVKQRGKRGFRKARGTTSWRFVAKRLKPGRTYKFIVRAIGTNGLSSKRLKLKVRVESRRLLRK